MSIYSANRSGCMNTVTIAANEAYAFNDCNRVIYESQINDMAIFESILASDFKEIQGMNEGTILEAEVQALNKESMKTLGQKIVTVLQEFWAKVKGIFKSAIQWVSAYIIKDGTAFVNQFESKVGDKIKDWNGSVEDVLRYDIHNDIFKVFEASKFEENKKEDTSEVITKLVGERTNGKYTTLDKFTTALLETASYKKTMNAGNIDEFLNSLKSGKEYIKTLNERMNQTEKAVNEMTRKLKMEAEFNQDKDTAANIISVANSFKMIQTTIVNANIAAVRNDMKSCRMALQAAMHDILKTDKAVAEAAAIDAASEFDDVEPTTALDPETQAQVNELIASADTE